MLSIRFFSIITILLCLEKNFFICKEVNIVGSIPKFKFLNKLTLESFFKSNISKFFPHSIFA